MFANRITRVPTAFDPTRGADAVARVSVRDGLADLVAGAAGCSPYIAGLIGKEAAWIDAAFADPKAALEAVLTEVAALEVADLGAGLRQAKRRVALVTALADLGGVWPLEVVTSALTRLGDAAVDVVLRRLVDQAVARGKLPAIEAPCGGMVALSMGKMGAYELNYSSDIDLIMLYDETAYRADDLGEVRAQLVRITRSMVSLLTDVTGDGYVFRTDLRLRPDASVTPVCLSMAAAYSYYESVGRTWERAAYIKARAGAGDIAAGERFLETLRPFVWRKHLDFAAIEDAHDMRVKIRNHKGLAGDLDLEGHNIKLGRGGIREIEFFTQTRQLIAGGRDPSLRVRGTVDGLAALEAAGWVEAEVRDGLSRLYRAHREVEHRVQMIGDAQTHDLPTSPEGWDRLAAFMGTDAAALRARLRGELEQVHAQTEGFFAPDEAAPAVSGFGEHIVARWPDYPALRSDRAAAIFRRLRPEILTRLQDAARPEEALASFDSFLSGLPAGVQLFSLFDANPQLTQLMVDICATAPALATYLSRNASVFDAVIAGDFFKDWPGPDGLSAHLTAALARVTDYEAKLDATRRWTKEWHFRIGVHHLRGVIPAEQAGRQYAELAEAVVAGLWPHVVAEFARKHGAALGRGACVLAMGSLGAGRLNAASDLDLIVIYDGQGEDASAGPRPLSTQPYFARLTQALITALTAPMAEGRLYEVDMRLRPSGRQGPVATSLTGFDAYQRTEAWTWEHLALTRARPIAGDAALCADVEAVRCAVLAEKSKGPTIQSDVADMRARLADARPGAGGLDAKSGRGRLQDVELAAQTVALRGGVPSRRLRDQVAGGVAAGILDAADGQALQDAASVLWQVQAAGRLLMGEAMIAPDAMGEGGRRMMLRETGCDGMDDLVAKLEVRCAAAATVFDRLLESDA